MKLQLSDDAVEDLQEIWLDISNRNGSLSQADKIIHEFDRAFDFLCANPKAGHFREDIVDAPARIWNVYSWMVIYFGDDQVVFVSRVIHSSRDVKTLLAGD